MTVSPPPIELNSADDECAYMMSLIQHIIDQCPRRVATSASEARAHEILEAELRRAGLDTHTESFQFNDSLYRNLALHFGVATAGWALRRRAPALASGLQLLSGVSYWADSTRRAYILRRALGFRPSRNVLGTRHAAGEPRLRVVLLAHVDAAFTGLMFHPQVLKSSVSSPPTGPLRFLEKPISAALKGQMALAAVAFARTVSGRRLRPAGLAEHILALPTIITFALALDVVLRDRVVPGANDNLSGAAALPVLARRLADLPDDVELVFVATGSEEAGLGGADALARAHESDWNPDNTVVIGIDTLSNGNTRFVEEEGEVTQRRISSKLRRTMQRAAATDPRFRHVRGLKFFAGGTDAQVFMHRGFHATAITCVDPEFGAARHYHQPSDTAENLDPRQMMVSVDFCEAAIRAVVDSFGADSSERPTS